MRLYPEASFTRCTYAGCITFQELQTFSLPGLKFKGEQATKALIFERLKTIFEDIYYAKIKY